MVADRGFDDLFHPRKGVPWWDTATSADRQWVYDLADAIHDRGQMPNWSAAARQFEADTGRSVDRQVLQKNVLQQLKARHG